MVLTPFAAQIDVKQDQKHRHELRPDPVAHDTVCMLAVKLAAFAKSANAHQKNAVSTGVFMSCFGQMKRGRYPALWITQSSARVGSIRRSVPIRYVGVVT